MASLIERCTASCLAQGDQFVLYMGKVFMTFIVYISLGTLSLSDFVVKQ